VRAREGQVELERLGLLPHLEPVDELRRGHGGGWLDGRRGDHVLVRDGAAADRQLQLSAGADRGRIWETGHLG
jgi:hypothetical protein